MIAEFFLNLFYKFVGFITPFDIPNLPDSVQSYVEQGFEWISVGAGVLANYVPLDYMMTLLGIILTIDGGIILYHLLMWILAKIPVFKIER